MADLEKPSSKTEQKVEDEKADLVSIIKFYLIRRSLLYKYDTKFYIDK